MPGLYTITTRATGLILTANIYNADHQLHVDNQTPQMTDDYSTNTSQMQTVADPGEVGTESLPTSLAGEIERLRFAIKDIKGSTQWYETPSPTLNSMVGIIGGTSPKVTITPEGSHTNTPAPALQLQATTSGTPAAGIGTMLQFNSESADENPSQVGAVAFVFSDVTAGGEDSEMNIYLRVAGQVLDAKYGFTSVSSVGARTVLVNHNTAERTWTFPDFSSTFVGQNTIDTLSNKTMTTPTLNQPTIVGPVAGVSGVPQIGFVAGELTKNADDVLSAVTGASAILIAGKTYRFEAVLMLNAASTTPDFQFGWTFPVGCTLLWGPMGDFGVSGTVGAVYWAGGAAAKSMTGLLVQTDVLVQASMNGTTGLILRGIVSNPTNAGTLQLTWAQNTSNASDSKILTASHLLTTQLN